ncbi:MAG: hypothetical protein ACRDT6_17465, partial [Micromonosporaceae bacterium]
MAAYQCLRCQATANDEAGCPACGAPPDPLGAELSQLGEQLAALQRRDAELRVAYAGVTAECGRVEHRIAELRHQVARRGPLADQPVGTAAAEVPAGGPALSEWTLDASHVPAKAPVRRPSPRPRPAPQPAGVAATGVLTGPAAPGVPTGPAGPGGPGGPGRHAAPSSRPEASTRSVQNILLILGGLLLGVAAIVFTAVAWAYFGMVGRAAILAGITGIALAIPVVLRQRQLTATAETVASLGLLLVLLDGWAAWTVNLFGVHSLAPSGYTALVFAVASMVAAGYQRVSRLAAPWFWALLTAQPVLTLLAIAGDTDWLGYAAALAGTAAIDLAVVTLLRRTRTQPVLLVMALILGVAAGSLAILISLLRLITTDDVGTAVIAGLVLAATTLLGVVGAAGGKLPAVRPIATGIAAVALVVAVARPVALLFPGYGLLTAAVVTVGVWAAARALPESWRTGPVVACWVTAGLVALPAAAYALIGGAVVLVAGFPAWHTDLDSWQVMVAGTDVRWQQLLVLALLSAASYVLAPETYRKLAGHHAAIAGGGIVTLGATAGLQLPWWSAPVLGVLAGLGLVAAGAYAHGQDALGRAVSRALIGTLLLGYALLAALTRPGATALTCA